RSPLSVGQDGGENNQYGDAVNRYRKKCLALLAAPNSWRAFAQVSLSHSLGVAEAQTSSALPLSCAPE
ncbi:MAG: hypothetical protein V4477_24020, partial [Pseudomonadota bacterium]